MSDTTFTNGVTLTDADWFNDVNRLHYTIFNDPADLPAAFARINSLTEDTSPAPASDYVVTYDASATTAKKVKLSNLTSTVPRSHLAGLTLSTAGSSSTMSIAAGQCADSTNVALMSLSAISKTTSAWAVGTGNGGLDTGSIANSTWYHFYVIQRTDTGVVDVIFSTSASSPTLPTNYTLYRRIGSGKTNGSAQWVLFTQDGDYFRWAATVQDYNQTNPGTSAISVTLGSVPSGVNVHALVNAWNDLATSTSVMIYLSDLAANDEAPSETGVPGFSLGTGGVSAKATGGWAQIRTNTSQAIRARMDASGVSDKLIVITLGWIDRRGRDA